jgi:hypothetical protein
MPAVIAYRGAGYVAVNASQPRLPLDEPGCRGGADCAHLRVCWTWIWPYAGNLPGGATCGDCGTWWRLDLIPPAVLERLRGEDAPPPCHETAR